MLWYKKKLNIQHISAKYLFVQFNVYGHVKIFIFYLYPFKEYYCIYVETV